MRKGLVERKTGETDIIVRIDLDGSGYAEVDSGMGFLDHMLTLFAKHGRFDLSVTCEGDTYVDDHHSAEDIGIALGKAVKDALGDKKGIKRYADIILPMDEALVLAAVDISGRSTLRYTADIPTEKVGTFDTQLAEEFFMAFVRNAEVTLHLRQLDGTNSHHIIEAMFKAFGRIMSEAVSIDERFKDEVPSTKGVI